MKTLDYLLPTPRAAEDKGGFAGIDGFRFEIAKWPEPESALAFGIADEMQRHPGTYDVKIVFCGVCENRAESYVIETYPDHAVISANDMAGVFYGVITLNKLFDGKTLPLCRIEDWPDFYDRGLMLENRFGSDFMTLDDYKKAVDYLSGMKYNQLTVGVYGCWCVQYDMRLSEFLYIPIKSHPELQTPRDIRYWSPARQEYVERENVLPVMFAEDYFGELIKYAARRNVKIKPLFNSLGHNTLIPRLHPELSAKDADGKPTKHGFCVSDEAVYAFMFSIYDEIIDRYLTPNGIDAIEIGLDEVYGWFGEDLDDIYGKYDPYCKCEKCRHLSRKDLMLKYIIRVCKYLKSKGMKSVYIYHDMLFEQFDVVNEELVELFKKEDIYDVVVLDWWYYTKEDDVFQKREINGLFRSIAKPFTGYYHWVIPMEYNNNIYALAKLADRHGFEGIESYSSFEYCFDRPFAYQSQLSWNISTLDDADGFRKAYAASRFPGDPDGAYRALSMMEDLTTNDVKSNKMNGLEYYWYTYVAEGEPYPRKFHESVYKKILADYETYSEYFRCVIEKSDEAKRFFDKFDTPESDIWYAIADHYGTYAETYLKMADLFRCYDRPETDIEDVLVMLAGLIENFEDFMANIERTRIEANSYVYLRNHSITLQFLCDVFDYLEENSRDGSKPEFGVEQIERCLSERYRKLR